MVHRGNTKRANKLFNDSKLIATLLGHKEVVVDDLMVSLLRDLNSPGAQIFMEGYGGSDLTKMAQEIAGRIYVAGTNPENKGKVVDPSLLFGSDSPLDKVEIKKGVILPSSRLMGKLHAEIADFSRKLHHDSFASVHLPYSIVRCLERFSGISYTENGFREGEAVREVFRKESKGWSSGLTSHEYLEAATTSFLMDRGLPVYGNVKAGVEGKDLFAYENN